MISRMSWTDAESSALLSHKVMFLKTKPNFVCYHIYRNIKGQKSRRNERR